VLTSLSDTKEDLQVSVDSPVPVSLVHGWGPASDCHIPSVETALVSPHGLSTHVRSDGDSSLVCGVSARSGVLPGAMSTGSTTFEASTVPPVFGHHSK
jgi:hypothetical protein